MDWIQIGTTFGVPVLLLIGIAWFVNNKVWPFVVKRIEKSDATSERFLVILNDMQVNLRSNTEVTLATLDAVRKQAFREERDQGGRDPQRSSEQPRRPR
jgi:hypothetical protein